MEAQIICENKRKYINKRQYVYLPTKWLSKNKKEKESENESLREKKDMKMNLIHTYAHMHSLLPHHHNQVDS